LLFKAFFDEFTITHGFRPKCRGPQEKKVRAILNYLKIGHYTDVEKLHYRDIECWQIVTWDQYQDKDIQFAKTLHDEIIPNCRKGNRKISADSSNIASSVAEALLNCKEHAYTGEKESSSFKKWYLGIGDYPNSGKFAFCIYDKGVGIKARLKANPAGWFNAATDWVRTDSQMIELAAAGRSGAAENNKGRGQGLKSAIGLLADNDGEIDIYSDKGFFSTSDEKSGQDRKVGLEGTLVMFSFPIKYTEASL
jgi:hypothetical protein